MSGILEGLRVIEGSAFVAAPLGGMTMAQLGADVIRFDNIGGGLDRHRWPGLRPPGQQGPGQGGRATGRSEEKIGARHRSHRYLTRGGAPAA